MRSGADHEWRLFASGRFVIVRFFVSQKWRRIMYLIDVITMHARSHADRYHAIGNQSTCNRGLTLRCFTGFLNEKDYNGCVSSSDPLLGLMLSLLQCR